MNTGQRPKARATAKAEGKGIGEGDGEARDSIEKQGEGLL